MAQRCNAREQLEKELLVATHQHMLLEEAKKTAAPSQLMEASQQEDRARAGWELAVRALQEHRSLHGC
jgi:hypothetical protein